MKIGYSMWGFLGPGVLDTPDGSRSFRRPFVDSLVRAGHEVVFVQRDRDFTEAGDDLRGVYQWHLGFPEIDALILEWRWSLPGRNTTPCGTGGHTCDLHRQQELLGAYTAHGLPTIIWDQDRQLSGDDPIRQMPNVAVAEYALLPNPGATTVLCPVPDELLDRVDPNELAARSRLLSLAYVGNQYDRDEAFSRYFAPAAAVTRHRVAGKWTRTQAWPYVNFTDRCAYAEVEMIHSNTLATALLLPDRYTQVGHMTARWFEALVQGCLPLLPTEMACAASFVPPSLVVSGGQDVIDRLAWLQGIATTGQHAELIAACLSYLEPFRASAQAAVIGHMLRQLAEDRTAALAAGPRKEDS